jgi:hypothetical protein
MLCISRHISEDVMLHTRRLVAVVSLLATGLLGSWSGVHASPPAPPPAGTTCAWGGTAGNIPHFLDCSPPEGFGGGNFHSVIVFTS